MIVPLRWWLIAPGALRPYIGPKWSFLIKTRPWGEYRKDWWTDADTIIEIGPVVFMHHGGESLT